MIEIKKNLAELGFNKNEIDTYISLTKLGEARASIVAKKAGLSRTTVISILERLEHEGLVSSNKYKGTIYWWIESPHVLADIYKNKVKVAENMVQALSSMYRADHVYPGVKIYDTKEGIRIFTEKLLLSLKKGTTLYTIDAPSTGNYQKVFSDDYNRVFLQLKQKRSIATKTLVPFGSMGSYDTEKLSDQNIFIRELPEGILFTSSFWITKDVLVLFSSKPPYLVAVNNSSITSMQMSIYSYLWNISKEIWPKK